MEIELKDVVDALKSRVGQDGVTLAMQDVLINQQATTIELLQVEITRLRSDTIASAIATPQPPTPPDVPTS